MAAVIQLVKGFFDAGDSGASATCVLDLYNNSVCQVSTLYDSWIPQRANRDDTGVWVNPVETMTLKITGTSHDNISTIQQDIDNYLLDGHEYSHDTLDIFPLFLRCKLSGESGSRQAMVVRGRADPANSVYSRPTSGGNWVFNYTLALERTPFWEHASPNITFTTACFDANGGTYDAGGSSITVAGDVAARIFSTLFQRDNGASAFNTACPVKTVWMGFRTDKFTDSSNDYSYFRPACDLKNGTLDASASSVADSDSSSGYAVGVDFSGGSGMAERVYYKAVNQSDNYTVQGLWGRFLVLLRMKATGTRTYRVRVATGLSDAASDERRTHARVLVDHTKYKLHEMGVVDIPMVPRWSQRSGSYDHDEVTNESTIFIEAEVATSGTGNLRLDRLIMMPIAEGMIKIDDAYIAGKVSDGATMARVLTDPQDLIFGVTSDAGDLFKNLAVDITNYSFPLGNAVIVLAAQREDECNKDDELFVEFQLNERWTFLRGSE